MAPTELVGMLDLEVVTPNRFRAQNLPGVRPVVFGGQLLAQSITAAARSTEGIQVKSMHTVFLRSARPDELLDIEVLPLHAGRTFGAADVTIRQGERFCTKPVVLFHTRRRVHLAPGRSSRGRISLRCQGRLGERIEVLGGSDRLDADIVDPDAVGPAELFVWSRFAGVPREDWGSQLCSGTPRMDS